MKISRERLGELLCIRFSQYDNVVIDVPFIECYHEILCDYDESTILEAIKRCNRDRGRVFAPKTGEILSQIDEIRLEHKAQKKAQEIRSKVLEHREANPPPEKRKAIAEAYKPLLASIGASEEERRKAMEEVKARLKSLNIVGGSNERH